MYLIKELLNVGIVVNDEENNKQLNKLQFMRSIKEIINNIN